MSCDSTADRLADYITGRLEPEERQRVAEHLDSCHACRLFRDRALELYAIDYEPEQPVPAPRARPIGPADVVPETRATGDWATVARIAIAAAAVFVLCFAWAPKAERVEPDDPNVALEPISVEIPELPGEYPDTGWLADPAQAEVLAAYTGKPVLTAYSWAMCPRCSMMESRFTSTRGVELVRDFVAVKITFSQDLPAPLLRYPLRMPWQIMMPAVVITDSGKQGAARFAVSSLDDVSAYIQGWREKREQMGVALDRAQFESCRKVLSEVPAQLEKFAYAEVLAALDDVIELGSRYRSRFVSDATAVKEALTHALDAQVAAIGKNIAEGGEQEKRARSRGRRLREQLGQTELGRRLARVIGE